MSATITAVELLIVALVVGIRQGGRAFERRTSEIMQFASAA